LQFLNRAAHELSWARHPRPELPPMKYENDNIEAGSATIKLPNALTHDFFIGGPSLPREDVTRLEWKKLATRWKPDL
jgi:hypothetical protein